MNEVFVFATAEQLQREFARAMVWVGVVTAAVLVLALLMARAQAQRSRDARDGQRLAVMALVFLAVGFSLSVFFTFRQFTELQLNADALTLRYAGPWRAERRVLLTDLDSVVAGGSGGRLPWTSGCRLRIWLTGGGHRVSALRDDLPRAQCEALRDRLSALASARLPSPPGGS